MAGPRWSKVLLEQLLLLLGTLLLLPLNQLQPLLLDVFPGGDKAMAFVSKSKVWRREWRGASLAGSVEPPLWCPCAHGETAQL